MFLSKIFKKLQGRTTAYILGFFLSGHIMAWFHKLDGNYTVFMSALLAAAIGHSYKDDKNEQNMAQIDKDHTQVMAQIAKSPDLDSGADNSESVVESKSVRKVTKKS